MRYWAYALMLALSQPGNAHAAGVKAALPQMVVVPAGRFLMGSPPSEADRSDNEGPVHLVTIAHPFAVSKYEVTFDEWDYCVADGGCNGYRPHDNGWGRGKRPVIGISWHAAQAYVAWLSKKTRKQFRLLSEAEWEYAARAGTTTPYYWGNDIGKNNANCDSCGSQWDGEKTAPVGSFQPNRFGLYDMLGNVWEMVEDSYHPDYRGAPADGSAWQGDEMRVIRGGSWGNNPHSLRAASRLKFSEGDWSIVIGFRVARTLP